MKSEFMYGTDLRDDQFDTNIENLSKNKFEEKINNVNYEQFGITLGYQKKYNITLGNTILPNESKNILIVTRGRSGSSFLGDLLSSLPGTFYSFEPLHFIKEHSDLSHSIDLIKEVFTCSPSSEYIRHPSKWGPTLNHNFRYKNSCKDILSGSEACFIPKVYYSSCPLFPIRLIKTIRLPFEDVETILTDPTLGRKLKVIFLFRDPRGRLQSLKSKVHWCSNNEETNRCNISNLCTDLKRDLSAAIKLKSRHPGNY